MNSRRSKNDIATTCICTLHSHKNTHEIWPLSAPNVYVWRTPLLTPVGPTKEIRTIISVISAVRCRWRMFLSCPLMLQMGGQVGVRLRRCYLVSVRADWVWQEIRAPVAIATDVCQQSQSTFLMSGVGRNSIDVTVLWKLQLRVICCNLMTTTGQEPGKQRRTDSIPCIGKGVLYTHLPPDRFDGPLSSLSKGTGRLWCYSKTAAARSFRLLSSLRMKLVVLPNTVCLNAKGFFL
jgi:hypothetical protein